MKILYCDCSYYSLVDGKKKETVRSALASSGKDVFLLPDLCGVAAKDRRRLKKIAGPGKLAVVACYPRAVKALFDYAGISGKTKLDVINLRTTGAEEALRKLKIRSSGRKSCSIGRPSKGWIPWFPVIEYKRCVNCKQCLNFCLFGVYELAKDGKVFVAKPENCKTNCPACAKVCPKSAIIFPKYDESPINGGEIDGKAPAKNTKIDYEKLLADDTYAFLHQRRLNAMKSAMDGSGVNKKTRLLKRSK